MERQTLPSDGMRPPKLADAFCKDTSARTGRSERAVQRDAQRGKALEINLDRITGTSLDKGKEIDALAKMDKPAWEALVRRAQAGEKVSALAPCARQP